MTVKFRQKIEQHIAKEVIMRAVMAGYLISVWDGEETNLKNSQDEDKIFNHMFGKRWATDENTLFLSKQDKHGIGPFGWVKFVYGNDGWDVVSDYTTNHEPWMKKVLRTAAKIENGDFQIVTD